MSIFTKIFKFIKNLVTRPGIDKFLGQYIEMATESAARLALVNDNAEFHEWKDELFRDVKARTGQMKDNWIAILIHLAYENIKASQTKPSGA